MKNDLRKFTFRFLLFASPFILIILSFFIIDPFRVIYPYSDYSGAFVTLNPDFISTEVYVKNRKKHRYNSFIFGSSKTLAYKTKDWTTYLKDARPYVYHSSSESLFGICNKIKFIDTHHDTIKNAIIILDRSVLNATTNSNSHLYIKHPAISNESWASFYGIYFKAYFSDLFFVRCIDYALFHQYRPYMENYIDQGQTVYDPVTNDMYPTLLIAGRQKDIEKYSAELKATLPARDTIQKYSDKIVIGEKQKQMLLQIDSIFRRQKTDYKIILSPNYDQVKLDPKDLAALTAIFGKENIYDYSGINEYTNNIRNYYEHSHYTIELGQTIFQKIYSGTGNRNK